MTRSTPPKPEPGQPAPRLNELLVQTGLALHRGLAEMMALDLDRKRLQTLDLDDEEYTRRMPAHDRTAYLRRLYRRARPRESDIGLAQTPLDRVAHVTMADALQKLLPGSFVVGEEASDDDWTLACNAPPGTFVWVLDAIDGSGPQDTVAFGYSANVILYHLRENRPAKPVMAVIVTDASRMLGWISPGTVGAAQLNHIDPDTGRPTFVELLEPLAEEDAVHLNWISFVGAQPEARRRLMPLFTDKFITAFNLGGAPAMPGLLTGALGAVVIPSPQSRHDAAPLLALASGQGVHFVDIESGRFLTDQTVRAFFDGLERPNLEKRRNPRYKSIPAMVVARDAMMALELANILKRHWELLDRRDTNET